MYLRRTIGCLMVTMALTTVAIAGTTLACHEFAFSPGSAFEAIEKLRRNAVASDDSPMNRDAERQRLLELRAAIRPGDPLSILKAGYWAELLYTIRVSPDSDGTALILKALAMRPNDPEYHFIAALALFHKDKAAFEKHWKRAGELSETGSAVKKNLKDFGALLLTR